MEKLTRVLFKGFFFFNRALFAYKIRRFASSLLRLGIGICISLENFQGNFVFQMSLSETPFKKTGPGQFLHSQSRGSKILKSGRKKEPKPKLFGPDIFQWGRGLPLERVGAKKFDTSLETQENQTFWAGYPGILPGYPGGARKV